MGTRGHNITPVRREFLTDLRAILVVDGNAELEDRVRRGLAVSSTQVDTDCHFGDNAFLLDRLEERLSVPSTHWYEQVKESSGTGLRRVMTRLTILLIVPNSPAQLLHFSPLSTLP